MSVFRDAVVGELRGACRLGGGSAGRRRYAMPNSDDSGEGPEPPAQSVRAPWPRLMTRETAMWPDDESRCSRFRSARISEAC